MMIEFYGGYTIFSDTGVDLTLLRDNLRRSVEERWENNVRSAALAQALTISPTIGDAARPNMRSTPMFDPLGMVQLVAEAGVEFVVIGGLAMRTHGSAHVTEDLDLCYRRTPANIANLAAALAPVHPYLRGAPAGLPFRLDAETITAGLNFTLTTDLGPLDLLGEVSGIGNAEAVFARSEEADLFGRKVRVLSLDALIDAKRAAGRAKDQTHLLELEELKKLKQAPPEG